jgi:ketosteroid isomerase-like protein
MSHESVEVVRRVYELFNEWGAHPRAGRHPEIPPLLHPQIEFHTYAGAPEAGIYRGREAVLEYHEHVFGQFETARIELEELLPAGDHVVIISRQHTVPQGSKAEIVQRVMEVMTIRDGLLAERKPFSTRTKALEAAGLRG